MFHVIPQHNDDDFIDVQKSLGVEKGTKCFGHFQRKVRSEMTVILWMENSKKQDKFTCFGGAPGNVEIPTKSPQKRWFT